MTIPKMTPTWISTGIDKTNLDPTSNFATFCLIEAERLAGATFVTWRDAIEGAEAHPRARTYVIIAAETFCDVDDVPNAIDDEFRLIWSGMRNYLTENVHKTFVTMTDDDWYDFEVAVTPWSLLFRFAKEYRIWQKLYDKPESPDDPLRRHHYNYLSGNRRKVTCGMLEQVGITAEEFGDYLATGYGIECERRTNLMRLVDEVNRKLWSKPRNKRTK